MSANLKRIIYEPPTASDFFTELFSALKKDTISVTESTDLLKLLNEVGLHVCPEEISDVCVNLKAANLASRCRVLEIAYRELNDLFEDAKLLPKLHRQLVPEYTYVVWVLLPIHIDGDPISEVKLTANCDLNIFYDYMMNKDHFISHGEFPEALWLKEK